MDAKERKDMKNVLLSDSTFHTRRLTKRREGEAGGKVCSLLLWQFCESDVLGFCFCCCVSRYVRKDLKRRLPELAHGCKT